MRQIQRHIEASSTWLFKKFVVSRNVKLNAMATCLERQTADESQTQGAKRDIKFKD